MLLTALKRVIVTPAVYPPFFEFLQVDIQSFGQKSHYVNNLGVYRNLVRDSQAGDSLIGINSFATAILFHD